MTLLPPPLLHPRSPPAAKRSSALSAEVRVRLLAGWRGCWSVVGGLVSVSMLHVSCRLDQSHLGWVRFSADLLCVCGGGDMERRIVSLIQESLYLQPSITGLSNPSLQTCRNQGSGFYSRPVRLRRRVIGSIHRLSVSSQSLEEFNLFSFVAFRRRIATRTWGKKSAHGDP